MVTGSVLERRRILDGLLDGGGLTPVFQPITRIDTGEVVAYEALTRGPRGSRVERPDALFGEARGRGVIADLDWACRCAAFRSALDHGLSNGTTLFINTEPASLGMACPQHLLGDWLAAYKSLSIVVELTERDLINHPAQLLRTVETMREIGWRIALDDVGAHPDSLTLMALLEPDVIKLDLGIVQSPHRPDVRVVVEAVLAQAEATGAAILAEGIETPQHEATALTLGATYGQGWWYGDVLAEPEPLTATMRLDGRAPIAGTETRIMPWERLSARHAGQVMTTPQLLGVVEEVERAAVVMGSAPVVLVAEPPASGRPVGHWEGVADRASFAAALARDPSRRQVGSLRVGEILDGEPLARQWVVAVVGHHSAVAVAAAPLGPALWDVVVTARRSDVLEVARTLLARVDPLVDRVDLR